MFLLLQPQMIAKNIIPLLLLLQRHNNKRPPKSNGNKVGNHITEQHSPLSQSVLDIPPDPFQELNGVKN